MIDVVIIFDVMSRPLKMIRIPQTYSRCTIEGKENADWILLDFGAVIVHIFKPEVRDYYQIEKMWKGHFSETSR